jgi:thioredoxin-related protein
VDVARVNTLDRESRALVSRLGVRAVPTFVLLDSNGREVWRSVGSINAEQARQVVRNLINDP